MPDIERLQPTRRRLLAVGGAIAAGSVLWAPGTAAGSEKPDIWTRHRSANGWPLLDEAPGHRVEGAGSLTVHLTEGDPATVLLYVLRRYCYEVDMLDQREVIGHTTDRNVRAALESNQLSGTALTIRESAFPLGAPASNGMSDREITVVEDILATCEGVVAWGGETKPIKQSHFQINVRPHDPRLGRLAAKIKDWERSPGRGAGTINAFTPARTSRARKARRARGA